MNKPTKMAEMKPAGKPASMPAEEWAARVDLAAVYRLVAHYGWDDVIYNHCSMRVPGEPSKFLMKQHELLWTEVTASNLAKVDMNRRPRREVGRQPARLHAARRRARGARGRQLRGPRPHRDRHGHRRTEGGLRMVSQQAIRFYNRIGYHAYEGITEDFDERERINRDLGQNRAMIMHNHGMLTVGKTAREAFVLMQHLIEAAYIQLMMEATGGELIEIPPAICEKTRTQYEHHDSGRGSADWAAYLRILDKEDKSYRN